MLQADVNALYNAVLSLPEEQFAEWIGDTEARIARIRSGAPVPTARPQSRHHTQTLLTAMQAELDGVKFARMEIGQLQPQLARYVNGYLFAIRPPWMEAAQGETAEGRAEREALARRDAEPRGAFAA